MSQIYKNNSGGGGTTVTSVTGTNGVTASPTTGAVVVSGVNATTSTVGVASFNPADFTVSGGAVTLLNGPGVGSVTAGTNLNNSGTTANPIINLNDPILQSTSDTVSAPSYSFSGQTNSGLYYDTGWGGPVLAALGTKIILMSGAGAYINGYIDAGSQLFIKSVGTATSLVDNGTDIYVGFTSTSSAFTYTLPTSGAPTGNASLFIIVKDESGGAGTHNITVNTSDGSTIDGQTTFVIDTNYGSATFVKRNSNWWVV